MSRPVVGQARHQARNLDQAVVDLHLLGAPARRLRSAHPSARSARRRSRAGARSTPCRRARSGAARPAGPDPRSGSPRSNRLVCSGTCADTLASVAPPSMSQSARTPLLRSHRSVMAYVPIDRFLVRAPLLRAAPLADAARRLMRDPLGASALEIASASLTAETRTPRAAQALDRYARRAAFRATPAGLLAGVTVGTLGARTGGATGAPRAHLAPSWARMAGLARALLEDPEAREQLHLRCAPSLLRGADRVRWLASGADVAEEREADLDTRLARILDACGDWTPWPDVRTAAAGARGSDGVVDRCGRPAASLPPRMMTAQPTPTSSCSCSSTTSCCAAILTPPLVGPPAARWMADRLAALRPTPPAAAILARAIAALDDGDLDAGRAALRELPGPANLDGESDGDSSALPDLVATLVHQPAQALTLDRATVERAARLAPLLFRLQNALAPPAAERDGDPHALDALADATELFGEGTLDAAAWALGDYGARSRRRGGRRPAGDRVSGAATGAGTTARRRDRRRPRRATRRDGARRGGARPPAAAGGAARDLRAVPDAGAAPHRLAARRARARRRVVGSLRARARIRLHRRVRRARHRRARGPAAPAPPRRRLRARARPRRSVRPPALRDGVLALSGWPAREVDRARSDGPQAFRPSELGLVTIVRCRRSRPHGPTRRRRPQQ